MVLDHLDHLFCSRNVCRHRSTIGPFISKGVCISNSLETFQTTSTTVVALFADRLHALCPLSCAHICSVDILSSFWTTNFSHCKPVVHFSNVVPTGIRMGANTQPIYLCVDTQIQINHSDDRNDRRSGVGSVGHRHRRIRLGSRRHCVVFHVRSCRNGMARQWSSESSVSSHHSNCFSCRGHCMVAVSATDGRSC